MLNELNNLSEIECPDGNPETELEGTICIDHFLNQYENQIIFKVCPL